MSLFKLRESPVPSWDYLLSRRFIWTTVFFLGLLEVASYWVSGMAASMDGTLPVPQPDTMLYCQAARRIVEGHAFSFSPGEAVSTGTTSVLYPFLLAIPYALGWVGGRLLAAGFWMNAVFYFVFLAGWTRAIESWVSDRRKQLLFAVLLPLAAQPALCSLSQSDVGVIMAVTALMAAGLAARRAWVWGLALVIAPWVRPEGMMCAVAVAGVLGLRWLTAFRGWQERPRLTEWLWGVLGVCSTVGVFAFNWWLTGAAQFSSVVNKGYFVSYPFLAAVAKTLGGLVDWARTYVFSLSAGDYRDFVAVPLLGGVAFFVGVFSCRMKLSDRRWGGLLVMAMAMAMGVLSVASSGWQGTNTDRYLAWTLPLLTLMVASGVIELSRRLPMAGRVVLLSGFISYQLTMSIMAVGAFHTQSKYSDHFLQFARQASGLMPAGATVGGAPSSLAYGLGDRRFMHLFGIYSPEFLCVGRPDSAEIVERLCHRPELRPDYLALTSPDRVFELSPAELGKFARTVFEGPIGLKLCLADWNAFDAAEVEPAAPAGMTLTARVDVGYDADERASRLKVQDRWNRALGEPFVRIGACNGRVIAEGGRVVVGSVEMSVPLVPGKDAALVVRSARKVTTTFIDGMYRDSTTFELDDRHLAFELHVDDTYSQHVHVEHKEVVGKSQSGTQDDDFIEFTLRIPGSAITRPLTRVALEGDHAACGYWYFQ